MALPVLIQHIARSKLGAFCERRVPADARDRVRLDLEFADNHVTLVEYRPHFREPSEWVGLPVARFRYNAASGTWSLFSPTLGAREGWRPYPAQPTRELERLIITLADDANGVFWG
jgi:hypothetical protein